MPEGHNLGHRPGNFVEVSILGLGEAPISIASSPTRSGYFELGVRQAGLVTAAIHELVPGDEIGIRGPFGTSFKVEDWHRKDLLLIAGGLGLAPMRSLIQYCEDRRDQFGAVTILYGARSPVDIIFKEELAGWGKSDVFECHSTVDYVPEGMSYGGNVGLITTLIPPLDINPLTTIAVIVGPPVMYKFVIAALKKKGLTEDKIVVSLERHMKCGIGKCGHCTIEHLYCCIDGPVFTLNKLNGLRGAI